jgi:hypothetical protein
MVKTIRDNITARLGTVLTGHSKLSYVANVSANKFGQALKRFGVTPDGAAETSGSTNLNTMDHRFTITLTDGYNSGAVNQINDDLKMERIGELQDRALTIYKDLQVNKSSISTSVLIINNLNINAVEFLEEEKVAVIKFEINIKYKI